MSWICFALIPKCSLLFSQVCQIHGDRIPGSPWTTAEELKPYCQEWVWEIKVLFVLYISFIMVFDRNGNCCFFSHTLVQFSVQCFWYGLVVFTIMVGCITCKQHKKFCPPLWNIWVIFQGMTSVFRNWKTQQRHLQVQCAGCSPLIDGCCMPEEHTLIYLPELGFSLQVIESKTGRDCWFDL